MNTRIWKTIFKTFSRHEGIQGDVNWINGVLVDGRPNIQRHKQLPRKTPLYSPFNSLEDQLTDIKSKKFVSYNTHKRKLYHGNVAETKKDF